MAGWKTPCEWRFLAKKFTDLYGPFSSTQTVWWHQRVSGKLKPRSKDLASLNRNLNIPDDIFVWNPLLFRHIELRVSCRGPLGAEVSRTYPESADVHHFLSFTDCNIRLSFPFIGITIQVPSGVIKDGWKIPCFNGGFYLGKSPIFLWSMASSAMFEDSLRDPESQGPRAYSAYSLVPFQGDPLVRSGPPLHCKLVIASMWVSCRKSMHNTKCRNPNKPLKKCRF